MLSLTAPLCVDEALPWALAVSVCATERETLPLVLREANIDSDCNALDVELPLLPAFLDRLADLLLLRVTEGDSVCDEDALAERV